MPSKKHASRPASLDMQLETGNYFDPSNGVLYSIWNTLIRDKLYSPTTRVLFLLSPPACAHASAH